MPSFKLFALIGLACGYAACHWLALGYAQSAKTASFLFLVIAPVAAAVACLLHGRRPGAARARWNAFAIALLLWAAGMLSTGVDELVRVMYDVTTAPSMLLFVLYGVPLVYALAGESHEDRMVKAVDLVLAVVLGLLFTGHTFSFAGLEGAHGDGFEHLRTMFDVENAFLATFALVRWLSCDEAGPRRFFGTLARFAIAYLAVAVYVNHFDTSRYGEWIDVVIDLPFLLVVIDALRDSRAPAHHRVPPWLAKVVRTGSPLILPVSLLVVSGILVRHDIPLATLGFAVATLGYGIRSVRVQLNAAAERERLDELARVDALTGLANRRRFDDTMMLEWNRSRRNGEWLSLVMIDIDHFKRLNDEWGHQAGDEGLRSVARSIIECVAGEGGFVARYGGEEFAIVLPGIGPEQARRIADKVRARIEATEAIPADIPVRLTVSGGVASLHHRGQDMSAPALVRAADEALYEAKRQGRNRIHMGAVFASAKADPAADSPTSRIPGSAWPPP